jgi:hypothetical protein
MKQSGANKRPCLSGKSSNFSRRPGRVCTNDYGYPRSWTSYFLYYMVTSLFSDVSSLLILLATAAFSFLLYSLPAFLVVFVCHVLDYLELDCQIWAAFFSGVGRLNIIYQPGFGYCLWNAVDICCAATMPLTTWEVCNWSWRKPVIYFNVFFPGCQLLSNFNRVRWPRFIGLVL